MELSLFITLTILLYTLIILTMFGGAGFVARTFTALSSILLSFFLSTTASGGLIQTTTVGFNQTTNTFHTYAVTFYEPALGLFLLFTGGVMILYLGVIVFEFVKSIFSRRSSFEFEVPEYE